MILAELDMISKHESTIAAFCWSWAGSAVFFDFYTANKAAQLDPIEALRYE